MTTSLVIAAPPLLALLLLLWSFDRHAGRSGTLLVLAVLWGGLIATSLVTLTNAVWLEQPGWYPYVVTPVVEELAKASLFALLIPLLLVPSVPAGLAYGLACGLGFALWENAAYFEQSGSEGLTLWLYVTRTAGTALLHATSTAVVGAAAGSVGSREHRARQVALLIGALLVAIWVHGAWNYVCLVLSNDSPFRRALPAAGVGLLLSFLAGSMMRERWHLRREILSLWQEEVIGEGVAKAMLTRWPSRALRRLGHQRTMRLSRSLWALALVRRQLATHGPRLGKAARRRLECHARRWQRMVEALLGSGEVDFQKRRDRSFVLQVALAIGLIISTVGLHLLGHLSPVPAALSRRTIVITSGAQVRPEPLITVMRGDTYVLWQRGPSKQRRQQMLTWVGPGEQRRHLSLGAVPPEEPDWFEMTALGDGVIVATRERDTIWARAFVKNQGYGELRFDASESSPEPCWPWLTSDRGQTLVGWDRLERIAKISQNPLRVVLPVMELPDPFPHGYDTPEQACMRGFMLTDHTVYEVARPGSAARLAAVDLDQNEAHEIDLCPERRGRFRIHSLDKDRGQILVLLGAEDTGAGDEYELLIARVDRSGNLIAPCRHLRSMPAGEPRVVGLAGAGDTAFLAWSTSAHIFLARVPLVEGAGRPRRWVLDRAPRGGQGVVRVGVVNDWLHVAWEGHSRSGLWSLKLLRTEIGDLP